MTEELEAAKLHNELIRLPKLESQGPTAGLMDQTCPEERPVLMKLYSHCLTQPADAMFWRACCYRDSRAGELCNGSWRICFSFGAFSFSFFLGIRSLYQNEKTLPVATCSPQEETSCESHDPVVKTKPEEPYGDSESIRVYKVDNGFFTQLHSAHGPVLLSNHCYHGDF